MSDLEDPKKSSVYEKIDSSVLSELKITKGFLIEPFQVRIEGTAVIPGLSIAKLKHMETGVDCYVPIAEGLKKTDDELAAQGKVIMARLTDELPVFNSFSASGQLGEIGVIVDKYNSAEDVQSLDRLRQEFKGAAQKLPLIPESLNQVDLVAVWDWKIHQGQTETHQKNVMVVIK